MAFDGISPDFNSRPKTPTPDSSPASEREALLKQLEAAATALAALGAHADIERVLRQAKGLAAQEIKNPETEKRAFQEFMFARFQKQGIVRMEGDTCVVRLDALRSASASKLGLTGSAKGAPSTSELARFRSFLDTDAYHMLHDAFDGKWVVSEEDWEASKTSGVPPHARPLVYWPSSAKNALTPALIKQQEAYLAPWNTDINFHNWTKPIQYPDREITFEEMALAGIVYHPDCGDGYRDEMGKLMVKQESDPQSSRSKLSIPWLDRHGGSRLRRRGELSMDNPRRWLRAHPVMLENDLLRESDFGSHSVRSEDRALGEERTRYVERFGTTGNGNVMFNSISHHLGREYKDRKDIIVTNIAANMGLCVERVPGTNQLRPLFTFRIFQQTDSEVAHMKAAGKFLSVGLQLIDKKPITLTAPRGAQEDERTKLVRAYLEFKQSRDTGVLVDQKISFSPETLVSVTAWMQGVREARRPLFQSFLDTYGELGGRFMTLFSHNEETDLVQFCTQAPTLGQPAVRLILERCLQLQSSAQSKLGTDVEGLFALPQGQGKNIEHELSNDISRRWKRVLTALSDQKRMTFDQLMVRLSSLERENALFASVFRVAFKGKQAKEAFQQVRGLTFDAALPARELDERSKKEMLKIFDLNWADQDQIAARSFKASLESKLQSESDATKFYVLAKQSEVMAFIRFDDRPDLGEGAVYGGSLNVHPAFRQSGIGEAMMQKTIDEVAREHVIHAHVVPDAVVGTAYVEQMRCMITGVDLTKDATTKKETPILRLRRDDRRAYRATGVSFDELKSGLLDGVRVIRFDLSTQKEDFVTTVKRVTSEGKVITRYVAEPGRPQIRWIAVESEVV